MANFDLCAVETALRGSALRWRLSHFESVASTMDVARSLASPARGEALVVLAEEQLAGRGRLGRPWLSPAGFNLYFTICANVEIPILRRMAMIAAIAVAEGIELATGLHPEIKWPNDVQLRGLKCSGVLIDSEVRGERAVRTLIGMGIDVNQEFGDVPELSGIATSLRAELGRTVEREAVLAQVLRSFERHLLGVAGGSDVREAWKSRLNTLGRQVRLTGQGLDELGVAEDVDADGSLLLRRADGSLLTASAGEVSLRTLEPSR